MFFVGLKKKPDIYLIGHLFDRSRYQNVLSKLTQMLLKKAKVTFVWFAVGGTIIRTVHFVALFVF